ncbi:hypothetical protein CHUAL_001000 [Chamberlinius hualienensis]
MRASVTVMFSNPPPDQTMNYPDYRQKAEDHGSLLILVKPVGQQMPLKTFNSMYDRITRMQQIKVTESQTGVQRKIWVRYKKNYHLENNEWGEFQAHRKVLGLISVGKCSSQEELNNLCLEHEKVVEKYSSTLFDSRCIIFRCDSPTGELSSPELEQTSLTNHHNIHTNTNNSSGQIVNSTEVKNNGFSHKNVNLDASSIDDNWESTRRATFESLDTRIYHQPILYPLNHTNSDSDSSLPFQSSAIPSPKSPISPDSVTSDSSLNSLTPDDSPLNGEMPSLIYSTPACSNSQSTNSLNSQKSEASSSSSSHRPINKPILPPTNLKTVVHCYQNSQESVQLEQNLYDFISSLFWVLESKRLDRSHDKLERLPLLCAPFEKKDFIGLDMDSRTNKKRCVGRMKKHIGDLCVLAGLPADAINYYNSAVELLKSANDWLWIGGSYEGLCSASILLLYPNSRSQPSLQRNSSFTAGTPTSSDTKLKLGGFSSLPTNLDPSQFKCKGCLSAAEIVEKYRETITHYRKYHAASGIETETCIKAYRFLVRQKKYLQAAEFLQNAVFLNLQLTEEEKIRRFSELSLLYKQIGFLRKAAFFKRVAAMRCVTPQIADPNWSECYHYLLQTLEGYKLSLDPKFNMKDTFHGWPTLQIQILQELVATSRRMGNTALSVRHMTFLLHSMFEHLSQSERKEFATQLESLTARCEGAPVPLSLDSGVIVPPVNLINLPTVKSFKLQNLAPHLQPTRLVPKLAEEINSGPFIFSPLYFANSKEKKNSNKMDFKWVEGDVCEVSLQVYNPLPFELRVTNMGLLPDGIAFETFPACLSLPAESGPFPVNLLGTPRSTGELLLLGYTTHVLGVKSNCRLKDISHFKKPNFIIDVVPALPRVEVVTSLPKSPTATTTSTPETAINVSLFAGESCECTIHLMNTGNEDVELVEVFLESKLDKEMEKDFCLWNLEDLSSQLPLKSSDSASLNIIITAVGDFIAAAKEAMDEASSTVSDCASLTSTPSKTKTNRAGSLTSFGSSRSSFAYSSLRGRFPDFFSSPVPLSIPTPPSQPTHPTKVIEALLKLKYSGGPGLKVGYCRICSMSISVEVIPSLFLTKWDVLPAESPSHCYLVLDILNASDHEMEVQYSTNKRILVEANDTCRIPVPVARCPLSKLVGLSEDEAEKVCRQHIAELVDLSWTMQATEAKGKASLASLTWNSNMLDMIKMCPLQWEVSLDERIFKPENEFSFPVGHVIPIDIAVLNYSDLAMSNLYLNVKCFQDYQNGQTASVEGKLVFIGCSNTIISRVSFKISNIFQTFVYRFRFRV